MNKIQKFQVALAALAVIFIIVLLFFPGWEASKILGRNKGASITASPFVAFLKKVNTMYDTSAKITNKSILPKFSTNKKKKNLSTDIWWIRKFVLPLQTVILILQLNFVSR